MAWSTRIVVSRFSIASSNRIDSEHRGIMGAGRVVYTGMQFNASRCRYRQQVTHFGVRQLIAIGCHAIGIIDELLARILEPYTQV